MRLVLSLVGALSWVLGVGIVVTSRAAFQETVGMLIVVNGTVAVAASAIIEAVHETRSKEGPP